jgi:hypothetical protein
MPLFDGGMVGSTPPVACEESHTGGFLGVIPVDAGLRPMRHARKKPEPGFRRGDGLLEAGRYLVHGMMGTTLIAFAGEPSMTLELTAR